MKFEQIRRPTVMMVGMDCHIAPALLTAFLKSTARVVCIGTPGDEPGEIGFSAGTALHWLDLNVFNPRHRDALHAHWEDEPLDLVVHMQALCHPQDPDGVTQSVLDVTRAVARGLGVAHGSCICLLPDETGSDTCFDHAIGHAFDSNGIAFSAVRAPCGKTAQARTGALIRLLQHAL